MKFTSYFIETRKRADRAEIELDWIESVVNTPAYREVQQDGRIRMWGYIVEKEKYLRVILLEDGETVHNVFFDRDFEESENDN